MHQPSAAPSMSENQENAGAWGVNGVHQVRSRSPTTSPRKRMMPKRGLQDKLGLGGVQFVSSSASGADAADRQSLALRESDPGRLVAATTQQQEGEEEVEETPRLRVAVRLRPTSDVFESFTVDGNTCIVANNPRSTAALAGTPRPQFTFDKVFNSEDSQQASVFGDVSADLVRQLLFAQVSSVVISSDICSRGSSSCSDIGGTARPANPLRSSDAGWIPRILEEVGAQLDSIHAVGRRVLMSCAELHNGEQRCLLSANVHANVKPNDTRGRGAVASGFWDGSEHTANSCRSRSSSWGSQSTADSRHRQGAGGQSAASPRRRSTRLVAQNSRDHAVCGELEEWDHELEVAGQAQLKSIRVTSTEDAMAAFRRALANRLPVDDTCEDDAQEAVLRHMIFKLYLQDHCRNDWAAGGATGGGGQLLSHLTVVDMCVQLDNKRADAEKTRARRTQARVVETRRAMYSALDEIVRCVSPPLPGHSATAHGRFVHPPLSLALDPLMRSSSSSPVRHSGGGDDDAIVFFLSIDSGPSDFEAKQEVLKEVHSIWADSHSRAVKRGRLAPLTLSSLSSSPGAQVRMLGSTDWPVRHSAPACLMWPTTMRTRGKSVRRRRKQGPAVFGTDALWTLGLITLQRVVELHGARSRMYRLRSAFSCLLRQPNLRRSETSLSLTSSISSSSNSSHASVCSTDASLCDVVSDTISLGSSSSKVVVMRDHHSSEQQDATEIKKLRELILTQARDTAALARDNAALLTYVLELRGEVSRPISETQRWSQVGNGNDKDKNRVMRLQDGESGCAETVVVAGCQACSTTAGLNPELGNSCASLAHAVAISMVWQQQQQTSRPPHTPSSARLCMTAAAASAEPEPKAEAAAEARAQFVRGMRLVCDSSASNYNSGSSSVDSEHELDTKIDATTTRWESIKCAPPVFKAISPTGACHNAMCATRFGDTVASFHCRSCGECFCAVCAGQHMPLPWLGYTGEPVRVCQTCFDKWEHADQQLATPAPAST